MWRMMIEATLPLPFCHPRPFLIGVETRGGEDCMVTCWLLSPPAPRLSGERDRSSAVRLIKDRGL